MTTHMLVAAYMATGLGVASVYAVGMLKGRRDEYHRRGLAVGLVLGLVLAPVQIAVGDLAAKLVADRQPVKLAAMEGQWDTQADAPLHIGGIPLPWREETILALEIPGGLSWLAYGRTGAVVDRAEGGAAGRPAERRAGAPRVPAHGGDRVRAARPRAWALVARLRRGRLPDGRWFLRAAAVAGPAAFVAIETGWIVTEVGRQPWIVQGVMRTSEAVTTRPGVGLQLAVTIAVYVLLAFACAKLLLLLARRPRDPDGETGT